MDRDFLGLSLGLKSWNNEETNGNSSKDSAFLRKSAMQWSFSSKVSAVPHFISFKAPQEEKLRRTVNDIPASSGFMTVSAADAFEVKQKSNANVVQVGNHCPITVYPQQQLNAQITVHRPHEGRLFPFSSKPNQSISMTMSSSLLHSHLISSDHNAAGSTVVQKPIGGVPSLDLTSVPSYVNYSFERTDARDASTPPGQPAKLTIFYAGAVHVYDDVSPEKARAIMLLARNRSSGSQNKTLAATQVQISTPRPSLPNDARKDQSGSITSFPYPQDAISLTYPAHYQSVGSGTTNKMVASKYEGIEESSSNQTGLIKVGSSVGSAPGAPRTGVALPQARKASLARFLEKRKDRVLATSPYSIIKKSP